mgnify:CR=1 FL=1
MAIFSDKGIGTAMDIDYGNIIISTQGYYEAQNSISFFNINLSSAYSESTFKTDKFFSRKTEATQRS